MKRSLRVTVVCGHGVVGGAELWLLGLLDATDRLEVDAIVLGDGPLAAEFSARGIPVSRVPTGRRPADAVRSAARLTGLLRRGGPDIVLANGVKAALTAAPAARLAGIRCVWVKHDHTFDGTVSAVLARSVDGVVATSAPLAAASGRADALVLEPPLPSTTLLPREKALARLGLPDDGAPLFMTVGRLVAYKGVDDAIAALAETPARSWRLAVVGGTDPTDPGEAGRLRALAEQLGVADRVHLLGPLADAGALMAAADAVGVLTKPVARRRTAPWVADSPDKEGFGMVALEAMRAGRPVVVTGPGAAAQQVGSAGVTVDPGDVAGIAAALRRLADAEERLRLGNAARERVAGRPDAAATADRLIAFAASLAARPGAGLAVGPPVSVVTTALNEAVAIAPLLDTLRAQLAEDDEIVVVDGGSTDGTAEVIAAAAAADARVRLLVRPGAGISEGRNIGIREARHDWLALTDAGCEPDPGWLAAFRTAAGEGDAAGLVTGAYTAVVGEDGGTSTPLLRAFTALYPDVRELRHPTLLSRWYGRLLGQTFDASLPTGRSMAFHRSTWATAGGFPEDLPTGEDVLFGRRAVAGGVRAVMSADAAVRWVQRPTTRDTARMYRAYGRGGGSSADPLLVGRDLARGAAYLAAPWLLGRRGAARGLTVAAAVAYCSLPAARLRHQVPPWSPLAALPLAMAIRDLSKVAGVLEGLASRRMPR